MPENRIEIPYEDLAAVARSAFYQVAPDDLIIEEPGRHGYRMCMRSDGGHMSGDIKALVAALAEKGFDLGWPEPVDWVDSWSLYYWPSVDVTDVDEDDDE